MKKCFCMYGTRNKSLAALCMCAALCLVGCAGGRQMASESRTATREREYARSAEVLHVRDSVVLGVAPGEKESYPKETSYPMGTRENSWIRGTSYPRALPVYRSHYETLRVHDTVVVTRTDTLIRTETHTLRERYVPRWLRRYAVGVTLLAAALLLAAGAAWYVRRRKRLWR